MLRCSALLFVLCGSTIASADDLHVAPGGSGDGTLASPFGSVADGLAAAVDGDRVLLHEGDYGDVTVSGEFGADTFVEPYEDDAPRLRTLLVQNARNVVVRGLSISLSHAETYASDTMVTVRGSSNVTIEDNDIFSVDDATTAGWSATDWADLPGTGISLRTGDVTLRNNRVRNVGYGISVAHDAPNAHVVSNLVENFSRDGLRGIGDYGVFEFNTVKNAYDVDDHHDDFFQSWSVGEDGAPGTGVVRGVVLRGNLFINFDDPDQPFAGAAQGIGCFDGFFEDWVVENNVVIVNHWHGITFLGARNMRIVNNTVLDNRRGERPGPPWIMVSSHKDGTRSEDIVIRNNLAETITLEDSDRAVEDHNMGFDDPAAVFVDPAGFDLHLLPGVAAIDSGSAEMAPGFDRDNVPRPQGDGHDIGAYEWHDGTVVTPDGGAPIDAGPRPDAALGPDAGAERDGGVGADAGTGPGDGGCGCRTTTADPHAAWLLLGLFWFRRRQ